ncbi:MAG: ABC transporter permease, partial [Actinomycetes bacterium]
MGRPRAVPPGRRGAGARRVRPPVSRRQRRRALTTGLPPALVPLAGAGLLFLTVPVLGLVLRTPWGSLAEQLTRPEALIALRLSLVCATSATALCVLVGVPLAWVLARGSFPGRGLVRALVTVPLVLPPVVGGVALFAALGRHGLVGRPLDELFGVTLPFTTAAVVVAESFVAMPFLVISVEGALRGADRRFDDAAATLGASRWYTFRRVTLPLVAPGIAAGAVLCWARAIGEFGATITFAGNFPGTTRTMPIEVYIALRLSLVCATSATALCVLVGVPLAW